MIYVTAGICGRLDKYKKLIEKIDLRSRDDLYVVGDIIGEGIGSIKVLADMSMRSNVFPLLGDREYYAHKIMVEIADENGVIHGKSPDEMPSEIKDTLNAFVQMDNDGRAWVMEYFAEMSLYEEITAGKREYLLMHSGIGDFISDKPVSDYGIKELVLSVTDYEKSYYPEKILVTGHTPTCEIDKRYSGQIYRNGYHIALNCTKEGGGYLAAICLDTGEEYYI